MSIKPKRPPGTPRNTQTTTNGTNNKPGKIVNEDVDMVRVERSAQSKC